MERMPLITKPNKKKTLRVMCVVQTPQEVDISIWDVAMYIIVYVLYITSDDAKNNVSDIKC